jgi:hypothetical protein
VERTDAALNAALGAGARAISSGVVPFTEVPFGGKEGTLVRDPDGHALLLVTGPETAGSARAARARLVR